MLLENVPLLKRVLANFNCEHMHLLCLAVAHLCDLRGHRLDLALNMHELQPPWFVLGIVRRCDVPEERTSGNRAQRWRPRRRRTSPYPQVSRYEGKASASEPFGIALWSAAMLTVAGCLGGVGTSPAATRMGDLSSKPCPRASNHDSCPNDKAIGMSWRSIFTSLSTRCTLYG